MVSHDIWNQGYYKMLQEETDLGNRMKAAFSLLFQKGYEQICIIGSDCYELDASVIRQAFSSLAQADMVIGPASDGGYYLLGMRQGLKDVFQHIEWSTESVLQQTIDQIRALNSSYVLLPVLNDVDTIHDVPESWKVK
jgi:rSAM/selenodomain-associated transferase 1